MKTTITMMLVACAAAFSGCQLTHVKTPEWEVSLRSHWFKRDVDKCEVVRNADGSYNVSLNGYKSDASEQLPAFTKELWYGLGVLGRLAGAAVNPAVAGVPLTEEAAKADDIAKLIRESAAAKVELEKAKAELKAAKASSGQSAECADGSCSTN